MTLRPLCFQEMEVEEQLSMVVDGGLPQEKNQEIILRVVKIMMMVV
jgi:hypothetical protein